MKGPWLLDGTQLRERKDSWRCSNESGGCKELDCVDGFKRKKNMLSPHLIPSYQLLIHCGRSPVAAALYTAGASE